MATLSSLLLPSNLTFPSGTVMLFAQTAAPTGWTKSTTHNDKALRVVSGTVSSGGTVDFSAAFTSKTPAGSVSVAVGAGTLAVGSTTLTTAQMPSHTHDVQGNTTTGGSSGALLSATSAISSKATTSAGSGSSHTHAISGAPSVTSSTFTGTAIDLSVKYVDTIIATKN